MGKYRNQYRPERHYMRGPGPKWHEKHGASPAPAVAERHNLPNSMVWIVPVAVVALLSAMVVAALA